MFLYLHPLLESKSSCLHYKPFYVFFPTYAWACFENFLDMTAMSAAADATPVSLLWPEPRRHNTNVYIPWMVSDIQIPWLLLQHKKHLDCLNKENII